MLSHSRSCSSFTLTGPTILHRRQLDSFLFEARTSHPPLRWHQHSKSCSICMSCILIGASPGMTFRPNPSEFLPLQVLVQLDGSLRPADSTDVLQSSDILPKPSITNESGEASKRSNAWSSLRSHPSYLVHCNDELFICDSNIEQNILCDRNTTVIIQT